MSIQYRHVPFQNQFFPLSLELSNLPILVNLRENWHLVNGRRLSSAVSFYSPRLLVLGMCKCMYTYAPFVYVSHLFDEIPLKFQAHFRLCLRITPLVYAVRVHTSIGDGECSSHSERFLQVRLHRSRQVG